MSDAVPGVPRARFVCCPCCYGGIQANHMLDYPRSKLYSSLDLTLTDYLTLGHAADQVQLPPVDLHHVISGISTVLFINLRT